MDVEGVGRVEAPQRRLARRTDGRAGAEAADEGDGVAVDLDEAAQGLRHVGDLDLVEAGAVRRRGGDRSLDRQMRAPGADADPEGLGPRVTGGK